MRTLASLLLATVALVPSLARTHDQLAQRTPAQQHSRFRWTNSCDSVPQKTTAVTVVAPVEEPAEAGIQTPRHVWRCHVLVEMPLPASAPVPSHGPLRAPPTAVL